MSIFIPRSFHQLTVPVVLRTVFRHYIFLRKTAFAGAPISKRRPPAPAPCEGPGNLVRPDLAILATATRAMCARRALKALSVAGSSGSSTRELVPVASPRTGLRWHVRAFDRSNMRFWRLRAHSHRQGQGDRRTDRRCREPARAEHGHGS